MKKAKKGKRLLQAKMHDPQVLVPVSLNMTRQQKAVLDEIAGYAGTTLEIVAAVLISTGVYHIRRDTKEAAPMP